MLLLETLYRNVWTCMHGGHVLRFKLLSMCIFSWWVANCLACYSSVNEYICIWSLVKISLIQKMSDDQRHNNYTWQHDLLLSENKHNNINSGFLNEFDSLKTSWFLWRNAGLYDICSTHDNGRIIKTKSIKC